ncbi:MAG: preprotein translocase subunit SecG [Candidatus Marinimicrobia bacterium]|nr:preprotein translocase subunit SecG [Candidatus Neomarinimicrobiota bacterium]
MYTFLIILHVLICILLVISVLMQASKGGGLSGTFGGLGSSAIFGGREAATFLSKVTTSLTVAFFIVTIIIALLSAPRGQAESIIKKQAEKGAIPSATLPVPEGSLPQVQTPIQDNEK